MAATEEWAPIPGFGGHYEASDQGRIRSLDRIRPTTNHRIRGKVLSPSIRKSYRHVNLHNGNGQVTVRVHQLVMLAFTGPRPEGQEVLHRDGDGHNNALGNLHYGTRKQNILDQVAHGTHKQASKTHCVAGHPFSQENTRYRTVRGRKGATWNNRLCITCANRRAAERKERQLVTSSNA